MQIKKAVILLGGKGMRLSGLFPDLPKALAPVAGRPFLQWQLDWLFSNNIDSVLLAAGYKAEKIQEWAGQQVFKEKVKLVIEPQPLGTGGAIKFAAQFLETDIFWVLNGDSFTPGLNFKKMEETHLASGALGTIAVTKTENAGRYGAVVFDTSGKIVRFDEKRSARPGWINAGVYLLNSPILTAVPADKTIALEHDVFPHLASDGKLFVFRSDPPVLDMGTPDGFKNMEFYLRYCKKIQNK